jgi:hypothetical protein
MSINTGEVAIIIEKNIFKSFYPNITPFQVVSLHFLLTTYYKVT